MNKKVSHFLLSTFAIFALFTAALPLPAAGQSAGSQAPTRAAEDPIAAALAAIEAKTDSRRKELGIPGMSLVIVKDGKVVFMKGLGYKDFEKKVPVTPDTQFAIGSSTKAFTALSVLMSQEEGKLSLDDSPKTVLPYFKINDPEIDKNITIRDLLTHGSGLNRTDLAWVTGKLTREEIIRVAGEAKPTAKLREKFQYQNVMYTAAGEIVAKVQKQAWEQFVPERIFKPLGMTNSTMFMRDMAKTKDYSFGYDYNFDTKETTKRPFRDLDEISPAGSINSSARDMGQWLRFALGRGVIDGKRLISEESYNEWTKPQMNISPNGKSAYGLGWFVQEWKGQKVIQHGGNIDGFNAMVAMMPDKNLGFVMLTNVSASSLGSELMPLIWGHMLGEADDTKGPAAVELPTSALELLAGKYRLAAANVDVDVALEGGELFMTVPGQPKYKLENTGPRQFKLGGAPDGFAVKFSPEQGQATEMQLMQPQGNFTLPRVKAADTSIPVPEAVAELTGRYESETGGQIAEIKAQEGKAMLVLIGQPPYTLVEKQKDLYHISPLPETYQVRIERGEDGKVTRFVSLQPEGEFPFRSLRDSKPAMSVDELMAKVIDASGGADNIRKITTRAATFDADLVHQGIKAFGTSYGKAPNKTATETTMTALGKQIAKGWEYFDGTGGEEVYTFMPATKYTGKRLEDIRLGADMYGLLDWKTNYKRVELIRTTKCGAEECYAVEFEPENGTKFTEYYSAKTFLPLRRDGVTASSTSSVEIPYTIFYSDYREVDGLKIPFKTINTSVSSGNVETVIREVKHNVPVADDLFKPRVLK